MTKLLKQAMAMMEELPEQLQDTAARQIMWCVEDLSAFDDRLSLTELPSANPSQGVCK